MNETIKNSIKNYSNSKCIVRIEEFADLFFQKASISQKMYGKVYLALIEASVNAIKHGNKSNPSLQVNVQIQKTNKEIILVITDMGDGFDYDNIPDPTEVNNIESPNGRGIYIISNLSDKLEFNDSGNEIKITFNIE